MSGADGDFAQLLYKLLIMENIKSVKEVAAELDMKEQALYGRLYGRVRFSIEEVKAILAILEDIRIADYFLSGSPFVAVERSSHEADESETVRSRATSTMFDITDLLREVEKSLIDDGRIDHIEKIQIEKRLTEAERSLTSLRKCLQDV